MDANIIMDLVNGGGAIAVIAAMWFYSAKNTNTTLNRLADNQTDIVKTLAANTEVIRANGELIKTFMDLFTKEDHNG